MFTVLGPLMKSAVVLALLPGPAGTAKPIVLHTTRGALGEFVVPGGTENYEDSEASFPRSGRSARRAPGCRSVWLWFGGPSTLVGWDPWPWCKRHPEWTPIVVWLRQHADPLWDKTWGFQSTLGVGTDAGSAPFFRAASGGIGFSYTGSIFGPAPLLGTWCIRYQHSRGSRTK